MPYPIGEATDHLTVHPALHNAYIDLEAHFDVKPGNTAAQNATALDAAIAAVPSGGVELALHDGTYEVSTGRTLNLDGVTFSGRGANATILKFVGAGTGLTVGDGTAVRNGLGFRDMTIRGGGSTPATGLWLRTCWQVNLTNVNFLDFATDHLKADSGGHYRIIGCQASQNVAFTGTYFRFSSVVDGAIAAMTLESDGGTGVRVEGAAKEWDISGVVHRGVLGTLLKVGGTGAENISIHGGAATELTVAAIDASDGVTNLSVMGGTYQGDAVATTSGLNFTNCVGVSAMGVHVENWGSPACSIISATDAMIVGNYLDAARVPGRSIQDDSASTGTVALNTLLGDTAPNMAGTGVRYFANQGAVTNRIVTGSRGGNAALADLLVELAALGIVVDSSSA